MRYFFLSGCSNNQDYISYSYDPPASNPCLENEEQILNRPGSPDAPTLYIGIGIETGIVRLSWTEIEGADYYILEESDCPDFEFGINSNTIYENNYFPEVNHNTFFRVCAVVNGKPTGWSKVVNQTF